MPLKKKLKDFLDDNEVKYVTMIHSSAYTALELAETLHIPGRQLAKTVILKGGGKYIMAVVTANHKVDLELLQLLVGVGKLELAQESEFMSQFPLCEVGAMPPFGTLYSVPTYVDILLTQDEDIFFNATSLSEVIRMKYKDYESLVNPKIGSFSIHV